MGGFVDRGVRKARPAKFHAEIDPEVCSILTPLFPLLQVPGVWCGRGSLEVGDISCAIYTVGQRSSSSSRSIRIDGRELLHR